MTCTIYLGDFPQTFVMRNYGKWQKLVSNQMLIVERSHVEKYCFSFPRAPQDHSFKDSDLRRVKALEMNSLTYDLKKVFMKKIVHWYLQCTYVISYTFSCLRSCGLRIRNFESWKHCSNMGRKLQWSLEVSLERETQ